MAFSSAKKRNFAHEITNMEPKHIHIKDYNYPLPDERIAKFPLAQRDMSKLLVYRQGNISQDIFCHLSDLSLIHI